MSAVRNWVARPVVAGGLAGLLVRAPFLKDPLGVDPNVYLAVGNGLKHGLLPYRDVFDHKGPLTYELFGLIDLALPTSTLAVRALLLLLFVLSVQQLASLVERHAGRRTAWLAAVLYAVAASSVPYEGFEPNLEQITLPLLIAAVNLADRWARGGGLANAAGCGAALAGIAMFKPVLGLTAIVCIVLIAVRPDRRPPALAALAASAGVVVIATVMPFAVSSTVDDLTSAVIGYNGDYVAEGGDEILDGGLRGVVSFAVSFPGESFPVLAVFLAGLAAYASRRRRLTLTALGWAALMVLGAKLGLRDFPHYFVPVLPPLCILMALGADALIDLLRAQSPRGWLLIYALVLAPVVAQLALVPIQNDLADAPAQASVTGPATPLFKSQRAVGDIVQEHTRPGNRIYVVTDAESGHVGQGIYWYADRPPAARQLMPAFHVRRPFGEVTEELEARPPDAVVVMPGADASYARRAIARAGLEPVARRAVSTAGLSPSGRRRGNIAVLARRGLR